MKKYVVERNLPGIGASSKEDIAQAATTSCKAIQSMNHKVQWVDSFVSKDKTYCVYLAESEDAIKEHSKLSGFPAGCHIRSRYDDRSYNRKPLKNKNPDANIRAFNALILLR